MVKTDRKKSTFILIDGNAILHRSYHAIPPLTHRGQLVNAVYGFISILFSTIAKFKPNYLAVAFDVKAPTFRLKEFADYKAKRVKPPQEFYDQIPIAHQFLGVMEVPLVTSEGYEADDVIATLARHINGQLQAGEIIVVTGDRDALQLVDNRTKVAMPKMGVTQETLYDRVAIKGKYGLSPEQIVDWKALAGDSSDNIPGVKGIGDKTAVALLQKYQSLAGIYRNLDQINKAQPTVAAKLAADRKGAEFSHRLVKLVDNVPIKFTLKDARVHDFSRYKVEDYLESLGFKSLVKRIPESHRKTGQQAGLF